MKNLIESVTILGSTGDSRSFWLTNLPIESWFTTALTPNLRMSKGASSVYCFFAKGAQVAASNSRRAFAKVPCSQLRCRERERKFRGETSRLILRFTSFSSISPCSRTIQSGRLSNRNESCIQSRISQTLKMMMSFCWTIVTVVLGSGAGVWERRSNIE